MIYYAVEDVLGELKLVPKDVECFSDYVLLNKRNNHMYILSFNSVMEYDENSVMVRGDIIPMDDISIISRNESVERFNSIENPSDSIQKDTKSKITKPKDANYQPFVRVVVNAILLMGKDVIISREDHERKMSLINVINKMADGSREITANKAREILALYTIKLEDLFKEDLVK
ncbi:MAG: hypothetical protein ACRC92_20545 [Peptostreptococcaceae bacterium]